MPTLGNAQRLVLGLAAFLFLLSCVYVPWESCLCQLDVDKDAVISADKSVQDVVEDVKLSLTCNTHYEFIFWRHVNGDAFTIVPDSSDVRMSAVNVQFLLLEWLGICLICLFTGGLMWRLQRTGDRAPKVEEELP